MRRDRLSKRDLLKSSPTTLKPLTAHKRQPETFADHSSLCWAQCHRCDLWVIDDRQDWPRKEREGDLLCNPLLDEAKVTMYHTTAALACGAAQCPFDDIEDRRASARTHDALSNSPAGVHGTLSHPRSLPALSLFFPPLAAFIPHTLLNPFVNPLRTTLTDRADLRAPFVPSPARSPHHLTSPL